MHRDGKWRLANSYQNGNTKGMGKKTDLKTYFLSLSDVERASLADDAGTTMGYIKAHLIAPPGRRKTPRRELMDGLVDALEKRDAGVTRNDLLAYFYEAAA